MGNKEFHSQRNPPMLISSPSIYDTTLTISLAHPNGPIPQFIIEDKKIIKGSCGESKRGGLLLQEYT
jgi:hypothetical protein